MIPQALPTPATGWAVKTNKEINLFSYPIDSNGEFQIDDVRFKIDVSRGSNRRPSDSHAFTLVKDRQFLDIYANLARDIRPRSILELGIFQGGGFAFLDQLFEPQLMSAVDISPRPVEILVDYVSKRRGRWVHFSTSQDDAEKLTVVVEKDLGGVLDMVVDDASHLYEQTKHSFEILFPMLSPGGTYIIEDWAWSHTESYQQPDAPWANKAALTNFVFELVSLLGSDDLIGSIEIHRPLLIIRKAKAAHRQSDYRRLDVTSRLALRSRTLGRI